MSRSVASKNYMTVSVNWGSFKKGSRALLKGFGVEVKNPSLEETCGFFCKL